MRPEKMDPWMDRALSRWIFDQWQIDIHCLRTDIHIPGSPERVLARVVIQDRQDRLFVLEKFDAGKFLIRDRVARAVDFLFTHGLTQALTYQKTVHKEFLPFFKGSCFQLSQFFDGTVLERPDYLASSSMGKNLAAFLIQMSESARGMDRVISFPRFSIKDYIHDLFKKMKIHDRPVHEKFLPVLDFLESTLMPAHDQLPPAFCHGDLHPLNVIWNNQEITAVIDWEFAGIKPDIYDAANLVGCAGIENPRGLGMDMVMTFLKELHQTGVISDTGWRLFPEYVLALRFAWLSEWLRKKDHAMIDMEHAFMNILIDNMAEIKEAFPGTAS
jgi:homoserine kinase type II